MRALAALSLLMAGVMGCEDAGESLQPDAGGSATCGPTLRAYKTACIPIFDACKDNEVPMPGGGCKRVGVERCEGGIKGPPDWTCKPIGPPTKCLAGWEKVAGGWCEPIVPPKACTGLTMAKIGLRTCQPIMDCGTGEWGNIKTTAATIFVDNSYTAYDADGSQAKPYRYINPTVYKAPAGAHIAVAAGTYIEDVIINRPMTIEGVCPQKVTINGQSNDDYGTVDVLTKGVTLRGVTVTGSREGVYVRGPDASVVLERVAVVGCGDEGIFARQGSVVVRDSLVSGNRDTGVILMGSEGTLESTAIRDTQPRASDNSRGQGISAGPYKTYGSSLEVIGCVLQGNRTAGIEVWGAPAKVSKTLIRNTVSRAKDDFQGTAILATMDLGLKKETELTLSDSVIANNTYSGIVIQSSKVTVQRSVVRDTRSNTTMQTGRGISATLIPGKTFPSTLAVADSVVINNRDTGILFGSSGGKVERTIVANTKPTLKAITSGNEHPGMRGYGIAVTPHPGITAGAPVHITDSLVSGNHTTGVFFAGWQGSVTGTIVSDTKPDAYDNRGGIGVVAQAVVKTGVPSTVQVSGSLIERNRSEGIHLLSSAMTIERSIVKGTSAEEASKLYGFGVAAVAQTYVGKPSKLTASDCIVAHSTTSGIGVANSTATLERIVVRETEPSALDQRFGVGIHVVAEDKTTSTSATIRDSVVHTSRSVGIHVQNATVKVDRCQVTNTMAEMGTALYGDGISAEAENGGAAFVEVADTLVQGSARAGVVFFGSEGSVDRSVVRSGVFSIVMEQGAGAKISEDNVYEQNDRDPVSFGQSLTPAPVPKVPNL